MRIHLDTRSPDEPFYFGLDFTPHFATCRLNEPRVLYLSKGIKLFFEQGHQVLRGGPTLEIAIELEHTETNTEDEWCAAVVDEAERLVNAEVLAIPNDVADMESLQPLVSVFRVNNRLISADMLAEELLLRMQTLRKFVTSRLRGLYAIEEPQFSSARERSALLNDLTQDGHFDPNQLNAVLAQLSVVEPQIERAFFLSNLDDYSEGIRSAILRAAYHLSRMTLALHQINKLTPIEFVVHDVDHGDTSPRELRHVSKVGDAVADEFASAVLATYSALDQTRKLFDFVMREPFGEAKRIVQRHFMDKLPESTPQYNLKLPMALPVVARNRFKPLYLLRSDLIHNQGTDYLRPIIYWGVAQEPVNHQPIQYVQYMSRDVTTDGAPWTHKWLPRFFSQKRDAERFISGELASVVECVSQTVEWLSHHMQQTSEQLMSSTSPL